MIIEAIIEIFQFAWVFIALLLTVVYFTKLLVLRSENISSVAIHLFANKDNIKFLKISPFWIAFLWAIYLSFMI
jgi:hypothetical protein